MNDKHLRVWFVVFVIAVFMAGIGSGMILDRYVGPLPRIVPVPGRMTFFRDGRPPGPEPAMVMHRLIRDLNLTAEQTTQLDKIFAERRTHLVQVQGEMRARFESEQRDLREAIEKILTPEQRKRFQDWLAREPLPGIRRGPGRGLGGPGRGMGMGRGMPPQ